MIHFLLLALAAQLTVQAEALTLKDVEARHHQLEGRTIQVEGMLAECQPLSCGLLGQSRGREMTWLSFEGDNAFDAAAQAHLRHHVVVEGVVLPFHSGGELAPDGSPYVPCVDRCPEFHPIRIVRDFDVKQD